LNGICRRTLGKPVYTRSAPIFARFLAPDNLPGGGGLTRAFQPGATMDAEKVGRNGGEKR
jgi:hypothetical protein